MPHLSPHLTGDNGSTRRLGQRPLPLIHQARTRPRLAAHIGDQRRCDRER
jgi:hypothetical protein